MKHKCALLIASFVALASCSDSGPGGGNGTLAFDYTGVISGNFHASGPMPLFDIADHAWAMGVRDDAAGSFGIVAVLPSTSPKYHIATFSITRLTPGSETVDINCSGSTSADCSGLFILFGHDDESFEDDYTCGLETGTLVLSTINENRATGTFTGSGKCFDNQQVETTWTVTNGTFNVPVLSSSEF